MIALLVLLAGLSYYRITGLSKEVSTMVQDRYPKTVVANQIKAQLNEMSRNMLNVLIMTDADQIKKELENIAKENSNNEAALANLKNHYRRES